MFSIQCSCESECTNISICPLMMQYSVSRIAQRLRNKLVVHSRAGITYPISQHSVHLLLHRKECRQILRRLMFPTTVPNCGVDFVVALIASSRRLVHHFYQIIVWKSLPKKMDSEEHEWKRWITVCLSRKASKIEAVPRRTFALASRPKTSLNSWK